MQENKTSLVIITILSTIFCLYVFGAFNSNAPKDEVNRLEEKIDKLEEENEKLKDDKLFYKELYKDMAKEYENRLHQLGIDEYILTDTSR